MNKSLKWTPAVAIRKQDNIISSKAREQNDQGFTPSYYNAKTENMWHIMSNEYMKIWFRERGAYEKDTYAREQIIRDESKIKRRFVQRMMTYKRPTKNQWIDEDISLKSKINKPPKSDYEKMKYKPSCLSTKLKDVSKETNKVVKKLTPGSNKSQVVEQNSNEKNNNCGSIEVELVCGQDCENDNSK